MFKFLRLQFYVIVFFFACNSQSNSTAQLKTIVDSVSSPQNQRLINVSANRIETRFVLPKGFQRVAVVQNSFGEYLRTLPLKPNGYKVHLYDGTLKAADNVYDAVIDMEIGTRDLQQCADAIMRLRAEYLFKHKRFSEIHFKFTNGDNAQWLKYAEGYRFEIKDKKYVWSKNSQPDNSYKSFRKYLDLVFTYAGTLSLAKELVPVKSLNDIELGDVFIFGGSPGHAVIVVDVAVNQTTGEKLFLLAQSYMPAQEIQVLKNPNNEALSPWYSVKVENMLVTPEWTFEKTELKRFKN